jgi:DNA helicase-2/ATP-dependent DNA helicase PcrA
MGLSPLPASNLLESFLEETCLVNDTDDWQSDVDRVTLMTLHASKGLEFPVVFIVAVEEGLLPHERSREMPDQLEEERRLLFVGITRAQQELHLSMAQHRDFRGLRKMTVPSSFLMELPRGEMELHNFESSSLGMGHSSYFPLGAGELQNCLNQEARHSCLAEKTGKNACPPDFAETLPVAEGFDDLHPDFDEPVARQIESPPKTVGMVFSSLTTAAELANGGAALPPVSPDDFVQGGLVRHPQYGLGRIAALSGSGPSRRATIDFPPPAGRLKFLLSASPLRPVKNSGGSA